MASSLDRSFQKWASQADNQDLDTRSTDLSLVEYFGSDTGYCGYCKKNPRQSGVGKRSHNLNTYRLRVADYQDMIDTNWRRSGNFCYNPINQQSCCPNYPIICKALQFNLTRSQRNCIKALNSYLLTGDHKSHRRLDYVAGANSSRSHELTADDARPFCEIKQSAKAKARRFVKACERRSRLNNISLDEAISQVRSKWRRRHPSNLTLEDYLYPNKDVVSATDKAQHQASHELKIEMHHVDSNKSQELRPTEHSIMVRYQRHVHKETSREWDMQRYCDFLVVTPLVTEPLRNFDFLDPNEDASLDQDKLSVDVDAPNASRYLLVRPPPLPTAYGTYHCCYFLDDKLIAVGVLDVLPKCITTVYFFYEPQYAFLNLGIYSALVEISMVRQMDRHVADRFLGSPLTDYYLGFYVHECKKMHYKTNFKPSFLLCSKTHQYVPTEICLEKLKETKYADFADDASDTSDSDENFELAKLLEIKIDPPDGMRCRDLTGCLALIQTRLGSRSVMLLINGWLVPYAKIIGDKLLPRLRLKLEGIYRHLVSRHERVTNGQSPVASDQSA